MLDVDHLPRPWHRVQRAARVIAHRAESSLAAVRHAVAADPLVRLADPLTVATP